MARRTHGPAVGDAGGVPIENLATSSEGTGAGITHRRYHAGAEEASISFEQTVTAAEAVAVLFETISRAYVAATAKGSGMSSSGMCGVIVHGDEL